MWNRWEFLKICTPFFFFFFPRRTHCWGWKLRLPNMHCLKILFRISCWKIKWIVASAVMLHNFRAYKQFVVSEHFKHVELRHRVRQDQLYTFLSRHWQSPCFWHNLYRLKHKFRPCVSGVTSFIISNQLVLGATALTLFSFFGSTHGLLQFSKRRYLHFLFLK